MPPFKVKSKVNAKEIFQKLNVYQLFTETAELDLITDDTPIGISGISHESVIEVTVNGTEGAAATGMEKKKLFLIFSFFLVRCGDCFLQCLSKRREGSSC